MSYRKSCDRIKLGVTPMSREQKLAVDAITMRDYPIIQAYVAWMAVIYVLVNLVTDIIYHYLDPRVRLGGDRA